MNYKGRNIDAIGLWSQYVDFPANFTYDERDTFTPKLVCPNPDHDTSKRHFQINMTQPTVHCFAHCGISGSYEHAIAIVEGLYEKLSVDLKLALDALDKKPRERTANEAEHIKRLFRARKQAGKTILKYARGLAKISTASGARKSRSASRTAKAVPSSELQYQSYLPPVALEYLNERGISKESIATWKLGWLPEEKRIAIPAADANGRVRFLIKRGVFSRQQPKYLYTEGFPKTALLFGVCLTDPRMIRSDGLILVEGSFDRISLHQHGLRNSGAILGTGISDDQCRIIARLRPARIYLWFDKDSAGIVNIEIAEKKLFKYPLYVVKYPKGKSDPAELTQREKMRQIGRAIPLRKFKSRSVSKRTERNYSFG